MKVRQQWDEEEQARLNATAGRKFDPKEDRCRHELAPETDLNTLLRRYSPFELPQGATFYGERDYDLDAVDAVNQVRNLEMEATARWQTMSPEERAPYGGLESFLRASEGPVKGEGAPPASGSPPEPVSAAVSPTAGQEAASPQGAAER